MVWRDAPAGTVPDSTQSPSALPQGVIPVSTHSPEARSLVVDDRVSEMAGMVLLWLGPAIGMLLALLMVR